MNRGNGQQPIFYGAADYARFLVQLGDALNRDSVILYAYCLMPTHFHLFVETPAGNLDRFMGRLTTAYAMYFRYKHYRPGHCFQGRYKAPLVSGDDYILRLTRYIHLNPVQGEAARSLPVEQRWLQARDYRWSSLRGYLEEGEGGGPVNYRWLQLVHTPADTNVGAAYAAYIKQVLGATDSVLEEAMTASRYAIGDAAFRAEVEDWVAKEASRWSSRNDLEVPTPVSAPLRVLAIAVSEAFGVGVDALLTARRRVGVARGVFVELACTLGGMRQRSLSRALGTLSEHAISKHRRQLHVALSKDTALRDRFDALHKAIKAKL